MSDNVVISQVNAIVHGSINALFSTDPELMNYKQTASLMMESVDTTVSTAFNPEAYAECVSASVRKCTALATEVTFKHKDELRKGDLVYRMLRYRTQITSNLNLGNSMDVSYIGMIPLETTMLMRLDSVPADQTLNAKQSSYIESTTKMFLDDKLSRTPSVTILGVHVNNKVNDGARRLAVDGRQLQGSKSLTSFDVSATVRASLIPPPFVNFNYLVEDAIDFNADEFRDDLVNRRDLQLDLQDGKFFEEIKTIGARPVNGTDRNTNISKTDDNNSVPGWGITLIILSILLVGAGAIYFVYRKIYGQEEEKEVKPRRRSTLQEDYMSQVYENAFRGFDQKESELLDGAGTGKGSGHQRKLPLTRANSKKPPPVAAQRKMPPPPSAGRLGAGSGHSRGGRSTRGAGGANSSYSSRQLEPTPPQSQYMEQQKYMGPAGTMDTASSDYARRKMARAPSDRGGGGDDAHSVGMGAASNYSRNRSARSMGGRSGSARSGRSSRNMTEEKAPIPNSGGGDTSRTRSTRVMPNQRADDTGSVGMRGPPPARIVPANEGYDDDMSSVGDTSTMKYGASSRSKGMPTSSHHTVKRNNGRDNRASGMGISSQHTLKQTKISHRNLGSKQGSGIDQNPLQSYMQDPEALLETGGQRS
jgi:hypothetical protein